jgi:DNA-binding transcriptional ArsR family regulator
LVQAGPKGRAVGEIAEALGLPGPTLSFHLAQLKSAGLVRCQREGRSLIYSAHYEAMSHLVAYLLENCCGAVATIDSCETQAPRSLHPLPQRRRSS